MEKGSGGKLAVRVQKFDQAALAKLLALGVFCFRDPVSVEHQTIARSKLDRTDRTLPTIEQAHYGCSGIEPFDRRWHCASICVGDGSSQNEWRQVSAIHVTQTSSGVIIIAKEEGGVTAG